MNYEDVITGNGIEKKYKNFELIIPELHIPKGFQVPSPIRRFGGVEFNPA